MKYLIAAMLAVTAFVAFSANAVAGEEHDKVFVCKYVGTPGVDERLQTGQNPISVSISSISGFPGVGGFFADAQGRSLVIAFDDGQDEPSCPDGQGCTENCNPPPIDYCPTLPGVQAEDEDCPPPPPVDVCPNLPGTQEDVPPGFGIVNGECVPIDITPFCAPPGVLVDGVCIYPPPPPVNPPGVTGNPDVFCDMGAQLYRVRGTIDGQAVDSANPPTIPGNTRGFTIVVLTRGDTSFRTVVFTYGDCSLAPPVIATVTPTAVTTPATPATPASPAKPAKPVAKPKPKPTTTKKPKAGKPAKPTIHKCKPTKSGVPRVWVKSGPDKGCHAQKPAEPAKLTG